MCPFFKNVAQFNRSFVWPRFDAIHNLNEPNFCLKLQRSNGQMGRGEGGIGYQVADTGPTILHFRLL